MIWIFDGNVDINNCWNQEISGYDNNENSMGIWVYYRTNQFMLYWKEDFCRKFDSYSSKKNFGEGDVFILSFNFIEDKITVYHNQVNEINSVTFS